MVHSRFKLLVRVGTIAVIWFLWLCRNDKVFNEKIFSHTCHLPLYGFAASRTVASLLRFLHDWRIREGIYYFTWVAT
jgi:hypothetical protein